MTTDHERNRLALHLHEPARPLPGLPRVQGGREGEPARCRAHARRQSHAEAGQAAPGRRAALRRRRALADSRTGGGDAGRRAADTLAHDGRGHHPGALPLLAKTGSIRLSDARAVHAEECARTPPSSRPLLETFQGPRGSSPAGISFGVPAMASVDPCAGRLGLWAPPAGLVLA